MGRESNLCSARKSNWLEQREKKTFFLHSFRFLRLNKYVLRLSDCFVQTANIPNVVESPRDTLWNMNRVGANSFHNRCIFLQAPASLQRMLEELLIFVHAEQSFSSLQSCNRELWFKSVLISARNQNFTPTRCTWKNHNMKARVRLFSLNLYFGSIFAFHFYSINWLLYTPHIACMRFGSVSSMLRANNSHYPLLSVHNKFLRCFQIPTESEKCRTARLRESTIFTERKAALVRIESEWVRYNRCKAINFIQLFQASGGLKAIESGHRVECSNISRTRRKHRDERERELEHFANRKMNKYHCSEDKVSVREKRRVENLFFQLCRIEFLRYDCSIHSCRIELWRMKNIQKYNSSWDFSSTWIYFSCKQIQFNEEISYFTKTLAAFEKF